MPRLSRLLSLISLCISLCLACLAAPSYAAQPDDFHALLNESGLVLTHAQDFTSVAPQDNPVMPFEQALRHPSGKLEIRYLIRPLSRISIDYEDPHNAAPEPNHLFPMLFEAITNALSHGGYTPNNEYSQSDARSLFNADWAAASVFDLNPNFSAEFKQGLMIAIHKDNQADAYSVFLFNDYPEAKALIKQHLGNLSFAR